MGIRKHSSEHGFAHLGLIIAVVGVIVIGGLVAWRFMGAKDGASSVTDTLTQKLASAKCEYDDKDLCKFFVSFKAHKSYKMNMSSTDKESGQKTTMAYEVDGDNTRSVMSGTYSSETISVGELTTYTKTPNGTWWKQTRKETQQSTEEPVASPTADLKEPDTKKETKDTTTYKAIGKEACGDLTCFKYQVINPEATDSTDYIWFDTKTYQLRRTTSDSPTYSSDTTFSYENVSVKAPAAYKELGENQYIMPGENEPTTIPSASDYMNGM